LVSVTMKELLEAGVHFGHQTKRWNPKMKEYIFGQRNGIYIIDLQKTIKLFKDALQFVEGVVESGKDVLMVGTKKQAQDIIKDYALKCETCYVNQRWLGGLLTNFSVIRGSVERLVEMEEMKADGRWDLLSKKEKSRMEKVYRKLSKNLGGIKNMMELPGVLFVIDSTKEEIALLEALKLKIPIVAVVDTNGDPENIDYPIPGNDDAVRAIELFTAKIAEIVIEGKKKRIERELLKAKAEEEPLTEGEMGAHIEEVLSFEETRAAEEALLAEEQIVPQEEQPAEEEKLTEEEKPVEKKTASAETEKLE
jgi:small subunit ribosomal protein S2